MGTVDRLFPPGVTDLLDVPHTIFRAIHHALDVLTWRENLLRGEEEPPKRIWLDPEKLREYFEDLDAARQRQDRSADIEDPVDNDAASLLING
jgi:hypothetical protein